ncbi:MAG: DUF3566 domain-containing protein [Candidatus Rokuibacteriota bacterium]
MVELKRVGVLSLAKLEAIMMGAFGLLFGLITSFFSFVSSMFASPEISGLLGVGFGLAAILVFPILYAIFGFVAGAIGAFIYNLLAGVVGGIHLELVERSGT